MKRMSRLSLATITLNLALSTLAAAGMNVAVPVADAATVTIFSDGFGTGGTDSSFDEAPVWTEGGDGATKQNSGTGNDSASPEGERFAQMSGEDGYICISVNATGYTSVMLSYYWRGDSNAESDDSGLVQFKSAAGNSCANTTGWTTLHDHDMSVDGSWSAQSAFTNAGFNNTTFLLRFRADTSSNSEDFRIDGVLVTGDNGVSSSSSSSSVVSSASSSSVVSSSSSSVVTSSSVSSSVASSTSSSEVSSSSSSVITSSSEASSSSENSSNIASSVASSSSSVFTGPTCQGLNATIYVSGGLIVGGPDNGQTYTGILDGTNGNDVIVGTSGVDNIDADDGDDVVCGGGDADDIQGADGADVLCGEDGSDIIRGGSENDQICGGDGDDDVDGGTGDDQIDGGVGTDVIDGSFDNDICVNGETNDDCETTTGSVVCTAVFSSSSSSVSSIASSVASSSTASSTPASSSVSSTSSAASTSSSVESMSSSSDSSSSTTTSTSSDSSASTSASSDTSSVSTQEVTGGGVSTPESVGGNGAYRGNRTNTLGGVANYLAGFILGKDTDANTAPGAFGGSSDTTLTDAETAMICSMRRSMPKAFTIAMRNWVAQYLAPIMNRDAEVIADALRDSSLCATEEAAAPVRVASLQSFPVDIAGYPVSSNSTWNACVRGSVTLEILRSNPDKNEDGLARGCAWYHTGSIWKHPDLNVYFGWNRKEKEVTLPAGYAIKQDAAVSMN